MSAKHTPGPWRIVEDGGFRGIFHLGTGRKVAAVIGSIREGEHIEANARLIAAAPEGLALDEHIAAMATDPYLCDHPEWEQIVAEAQALITKVTP